MSSAEHAFGGEDTWVDPVLARQTIGALTNTLRGMSQVYGVLDKGDMRRAVEHVAAEHFEGDCDKTNDVIRRAFRNNIGIVPWGNE